MDPPKRPGMPEKRKESEEERQDAHGGHGHDDEENDDDNNNNEEESRAYQQVFQNLLRSMIFEGRPAHGSNEALMKTLKKNGLLRSEPIERALLTIPRGLFVTPDLDNEAFVDAPIRVATMNFNISAPHMYAMCLEALQIEPGMSFLDIGSGCGHFTALGGFLVGPTGVSHGLEIRRDIMEFAEANLRRVKAQTGMALSNVKFFVRNCFLPDPEGHTYDRIHVGACCPEARMSDLYALLNPRGILVTPFKDKLTRVTKDLNGVIKLEALSSVKYGDLVIPSEVEVKAAQLAVQRMQAMIIKVPPDDLAKDLLRLVNCPDFSDLTFLVEEKRVPVHKFILVARSAHFRAMLNGGMKESKEAEIAIPTCSFATFIIILKFLYAGDVCSVNEHNALEVLEQANYFKCDRLKAYCEDIIHQGITVENAAALLQVADRFDARQLKACVSEYIVRNFQAVSATEAFKELDRDTMVYFTNAVIQHIRTMESSS